MAEEFCSPFSLWPTDGSLDTRGEAVSGDDRFILGGLYRVHNGQGAMERNSRGLKRMGQTTARFQDLRMI